MKFQDVIFSIKEGRTALLNTFRESEFLLGPSPDDPSKTALLKVTGDQIVVFDALAEYLTDDGWSLKPEYSVSQVTVSITDLENAWDFAVANSLQIPTARRSTMFKAFLNYIGVS